METGPTTKSPWTLALMAGVLLPAATTFAVTGDAPQTLVLTVLGLGLSSAWRRPLERTTRSFVYAGLGAVLAAVVSDQAFPVEARRFFLMPAELYCPLVLYLAVALTFFDQRDSNVAAVVGLGLVAMMMAGNVLGFQVEHVRLPLTEDHAKYLHGFYGLAVAVQLSACLLLLPRAAYRRIHRGGAGHMRLARGLVVACLLVVGMGVALGMWAGARKLESLWQTGFVRLMQRYALRHGDRVVFGSEVDLWRTVPLQTEADDRIVIRALGTVEPGYLRGRAYTTYQDGRWSSAKAGRALAAEQPGGNLAYTVFRREPARQLPADSSRPAVLDVFPAREFRSDVLLAPGNGAAFQLIADELNDSTDGELTPSDWERRVGYTVIAPLADAAAAFDAPAPEAWRETVYLGVPKELHDQLGSVAEEAFSDAPAAATLGPACRALGRFFGSRFTYALGAGVDVDGGDPVLQFLTVSRQGHCELFATATVLLLRRQGIPARYVTGFVCAESQGRGNWVARLRDAHAWAEAYDADLQQWVLVEMTPAGGLPQGQRRSGWLGTGWDRLGFTWQHVLALLKRGTIAEAIVTAVKAIGRLAAWTLINPFGLPIAALVVWRLLRRRRLRRAASDARETLSAARAEMQRSYLQAVQSLQRLLPGLPSAPTPERLAAALEAHLDGSGMPQALRDYEAWRFGPRLPERADALRIADALRRGLRECRGLSRRQDAARQGTAPTMPPA